MHSRHIVDKTNEWSGITIQLLVHSVQQAKACNLVDILKLGLRIVQFRAKPKICRDGIEQIEAIHQICCQYGALFIINDYVDIAAAIGAHGVHLGQRDMPMQRARRILGKNKIIGISCTNSLEKGVEAQSNGADYVSFGSIFPSPTKPEAAHMETQKLRHLRQHIHIPICVIGGITSRNIASLFSFPIDLVAISSAVVENKEPVAEFCRCQQKITSFFSRAPRSPFRNFVRHS